MSPTEAAKLLDLPVDATPEQIETRFNELRAKLEDKVAKAPTPGLKVKYRESLDDITAAFEALTLAADSSSLPMLQRQRTENGGQKTGSKPAASPDSGLRSQVSGLPLAKRAKSGGKEFAVVALIAVAVLGAGGWWVMKTRTEDAEKVRVAAQLATELAEQAAQQKAAAEQAARTAAQRAEEENVRLTAAARAEQVRLEQLGLKLRARFSELNIALDAALKLEAQAERELAEYRAEERSVQRGAKGSPTPDLRAAQATTQAYDRYFTWLSDRFAASPARATRARLEEFVDAKAWDEVAAAIDGYAAAIKELQEPIPAKRDEWLVLHGSLHVTAEPAEVDFVLTDVFGRTSNHRTPAELTDIPFGGATITFQRPGWPVQERKVNVQRGPATTATTDLVGGALAITSEPFAVDYELTGQGRTESGRTPAKFAELPVGEYRLALRRQGWPGQDSVVTITRGGSAATNARFTPPGSLSVTSQPAGAEVSLNGHAAGVTPLLLAELPPGAVRLELKRADFRPVELQGTIESGKELALTATLRSTQLTPEEAYDKFSRDLAGVWLTPHGGMGRNVNHYYKFTAGSADFQWRMSVMKQKVRMVEFDPHTNTITAQHLSLMAMGVKVRLQLRGDVLSAIYPNGQNMDFRRVADSDW